MTLSCSSTRNNNLEIDERIDKELKPFVLEFQKEFRSPVRLPVRLGNIDDKFAGVCETMFDGFRQVIINEKAWRRLTLDQREELVFHELIHCVLDISHIDGQYPKNGCPLSIMHPRLFTVYQGRACYNRYKDYYIGQIKIALNK